MPIKKSGRCSYAQRSIVRNLRNWAKERSLTFGFIVGQHFGGTDYVLNCIPSDQYAGCEAKNLRDVCGASFAEHAKRVTYSLPGGFWVLGIFVVTDRYVFANDNEMDKLRNLVVAVNSELSRDPHLRGKPPCENYLIFSFSSSAGQCKELSINSSLPAEPSLWYFSLTPDVWCSGSYMWNCLAPFDFSDCEKQGFQSSHIKGKMDAFRDRIENCIWTINSKAANPYDKIHSHLMFSKNGGQTLERVFHVNVYMSNDPPDLEHLSCTDDNENEDVSTLGILTNKVFVHSDATVLDAVRAVQDDLSRSWVSRLQISMENYTKGLTFRPSQPRRVLLRTNDSKVYYSHYLPQYFSMVESENRTHFRKVLGIDLEESTMFDPDKKALGTDETDTPTEEEFEESNIFLFIFSLIILFSGLLYLSIIKT